MSNIFVISGPSGSGKTTVCRAVTEADEKVRISVSATTRAPRAGEIDGREYFFLSADEFEKRVRAGQFYEHADNFTNRYGTLKSHVDGLIGDGYDVILEIDVQGAMQVKAQNDRAVLIFIMPPSFDELRQRLTGRSSETAEQIQLRLEKAEEEMLKSPMYDYIVINDSVEKSTAAVLDIIRELRNR